MECILLNLFFGGCLLVLCCVCSNENMIFTTHICSKKISLPSIEMLGILLFHSIFAKLRPHPWKFNLAMLYNIWKTGHSKDRQVILKVEINTCIYPEKTHQMNRFKHMEINIVYLQCKKVCQKPLVQWS